LWHLVRLFSREACWNEIAPGLFLGRRAFPRELPSGVTLIVDLTGEFPAPRGARKGRDYLCFPILDAASPDEAGLRALIEQVAAWQGVVYIHCAQGHGRSALVMAGVLLRRGLARDAAEAIQRLKTARPGIRIKRPQRELLGRLVLVPDRDRNE
jgi:protein-tyrosine phosphatase